MKFPREWQNFSRVFLDGVTNQAKKCFVGARNLSAKGADEDKLGTTVQAEFSLTRPRHIEPEYLSQNLLWAHERAQTIHHTNFYPVSRFNMPGTCNKSLVALSLIKSLIIIFHSPQTTAFFPKAFLFYIISFYWVVSFVEVRNRRLGLGYSATISYELSFVLLFKFGGVYSAGTHDALRAEDRKRVPFHDG